MKNVMIWVATVCSANLLMAQNVGIGISTPKARLHVADSSVVFSANDDVPAQAADVPLSGAGRRMLWYASKAAIRFGYVSGNQWNKDSIGAYSMAAGKNVLAKALGTVALGGNCSASNAYAIAAGEGCRASGSHSFAIGLNTEANGNYATALGSGTIASGTASFAGGAFAESSGLVSFASGYNAKATGNYSQAIGEDAVASGPHTTAIGTRITASGDYSVALGTNLNTNGMVGAVLIGDHSAVTDMMAASPHTFRARFANGYRFFTSSDLSTSAYLGPGANAWSTNSSVYLKENFKPIDGETFLQKIHAMKLTSWNYIGQDKTSFRHYGPMAQDFYAAFGNDGIGTIGEETSINQADFDGVNLVAIQALEKRTADLQHENFQLKKRLDKLEKLLTEKTPQ